MTENQDLHPPAITGADHGHAAGRAILSAIPVAGGAVVEIFNALLTPPIEQRRMHWMASVASAIEQLQKFDAGIVEKLKNSEQFQSVLLHASWAAVRNHQLEKLTALKNSVLNAARGTSTSEDLQLLFVRYVDELTPLHLTVLNFLVKNESEVLNFESYQSLFDFFVTKTGLQLDKNFFKLVSDDLKARSLVRISEHLTDFPGLYEADLLSVGGDKDSPRILVTDLGRAFITFISQ
jgi:hypothetical protein